ncbi:MAG: hypothetical protein AAF480_02620 [Actinomycetota bacterium]
MALSHVIRPLRRTGTLLAVVALVATSLVVAAPTATAASTCFGLEPTIEAVAGVVTVGTDGDDVIVGTPGPDVIRGNGGDDRICSKGGADDVDGGPGADLITLGSGDDIARGGTGADLIRGKSGADRIWGNGGADQLIGGSGADRILGGKGRDEISGNSGSDVLRGNSARDRISGGKGDDVIEGGTAGDMLFGNSGRDILRGNSGTDTCVGGTGQDSLSGCEATTPPPAPAPTATPTATPEAQADPEPTSTPVTPSATPTSTPVSPTATPTSAPVSPTATPTPTATSTPGAPTATPTPTPTATPDAVAVMSSFIDTSIVGVYSGSYPWLNTAWDFLQADGTTLVEDLSPGIAGTVSVSCSWSSVALGSCGNTTMRIDVNHTTNIDVIIHELAHVLEVPTGVLTDPGPLGMAQMYFNVEWASFCDPSEVFADTLLHMTKPDAFLAYYSFACPLLPDEPTAAAEAVIASVLAGNDPAWFSATYANGTEAWTAVMTLPLVDRVRVVTNLANEFGGYCSISNTMITAFFGGSDPNPWADDGC